MTPLPEPSVSPAAYDERYYREWCAGYEEWVASEGREIAGIYPGFLAKAQLAPGEVVVDIGTGRGELLPAALRMGASHAYGVEYSPDAVSMTMRTLAAHGVEDRAEVVLADARSIPLPDSVADLVCYVDVVEHLTADELHASLLQARRLLKPTGRLVVHTAPNRMIYDVTYRVLRALVWRSWPSNPRNEVERLMHVNEQTRRSLRDALRRAGFVPEVELGMWVYDDFLPSMRARRIYKLLSRIKPLAQLAVGDLWAVGRMA